MPVPEVVLPLTVRDLTAEDLPESGWRATYRASVARELERAGRGEVDYLAVVAPSGVPVATGAVDYTKPPDAATLYQLSVHEALRSCGIGTILIEALEQRIRDHGVRWAELGVDDKYARPKALYARLGYVPSGHEVGAWDQEAADGSVSRYETTITLMRKELR